MEQGAGYHRVGTWGRLLQGAYAGVLVAITVLVAIAALAVIASLVIITAVTAITVLLTFTDFAAFTSSDAFTAYIVSAALPTFSTTFRTPYPPPPRALFQQGWNVRMPRLQKALSRYYELPLLVCHHKEILNCTNDS
jgi:hypothetical protein